MANSIANSVASHLQTDAYLKQLYQSTNDAGYLPEICKSLIIKKKGVISDNCFKCKLIRCSSDV
jgi:transglutaminase/protease-like cytokinesis protein 3